MIYVWGCVQCRYSTKNITYILGLTGIVKIKTPNVYIKVEGNITATNEFMTWSKKQSEYVKVTELKSIKEGIKGYKCFEIIGEHNKIKYD